MLVEHSGRAPRLEMVSFKKLNKGTLALGVVFKVSGGGQSSVFVFIVFVSIFAWQQRACSQSVVCLLLSGHSSLLRRVKLCCWRLAFGRGVTPDAALTSPLGMIVLTALQNRSIADSP